MTAAPVLDADREQAPVTAAEGRGVAVGSWARVVGVVGARMYRAILLGLVAIAVLPVLAGWGSYVVKSGSMEPSIQVGDVVLAKPLSPDEPIRVGRVFVFDDPATTRPHLMVHRIVERRDDGDYTTAGDANDLTDVTPLRRSDVRATAVLLAPYVGLPVAWVQSGDWIRLALWLLVTTGAFALASRRLDGQPERGRLLRQVRDRTIRRPPDGPDLRGGPGGGSATTGSEAGSRSPSTGRMLRTRVPLTTAAGLVLLATVTSTVSAGFTGHTRSSGMSWTVGATMLPYAAAVMADKPASFWLLDETSGTQAADRSGNNRGAAMTGVTVGVPGALSIKNPGTAVRLDGSTDRIVSGGTAQAAPSSFTVEMWFKKNGGLGGKMIGFENSQGATSGNADRTVFIRNSGRIVYGAWTAFGQDSIESAAAYDDNVWHHLAVAVTSTASASNARMYVDGVQVASGPTTVPASYTGWWRVGYGTLPSFLFGYPTAALSSDIDNVAIYNTALSAQRIAAHYAAR